MCSPRHDINYNYHVNTTVTAVTVLVFILCIQHHDRLRASSCYAQMCVVITGGCLARRGTGREERVPSKAAAASRSRERDASLNNNIRYRWIVINDFPRRKGFDRFLRGRPSSDRNAR